MSAPAISRLPRIFHDNIRVYQDPRRTGGTEHRRGDTAEIEDNRQVMIGFEAILSRNSAQSPHLLNSQNTWAAPGIVRGLQLIEKK